MEKSTFCIFEEYLEQGDLKGIKSNLKPLFVERIIDKILKLRPMHIACMNGHIDIVKLLIKKKGNIESETSNKSRPIHLACCNGHVEIVKLLIDQKCNIESEMNNKWRPIHYACSGGYTQIAKLLIESKCNIESEDNAKRRPIHFVCEKGYIEIARLLIDQKCNIESETVFKWRPIHYACWKCHIDIVTLLIEHNCEIEVRNGFGKTPLDLAKSNLHNEIVKFIEEKIEELTKKDILKSTEMINKIFKFVDRNFSKSSVIETNVDDKQSVAELVLYHFAELEDGNSFRWLLNIEITNPKCFINGETLLTQLLRERKFNFCHQIFQSQKNSTKYVNLKNTRNQTPLQVSIEIESMEMVHLLIRETDDLENEDSEGQTALMQMFVKMSDVSQHLEFVNAVKALICHGGNVYYETSKGEKIIDYCFFPEIKKEIETLFKIEHQKRKNSVGKKMKNIHEVEKIFVEKVIERKTCNICVDREVDSVFDCGHTICHICCDRIKQCPFCGFQPVRARRIYFN